LKVKKGDFVNIDYVGDVDGRIFDLTDESLAKKHNIHNEKTKYGPVTIVVGASHLLKGIDKNLEGKEAGEAFEADIAPEDAFGRKNPKLLKIISGGLFKEQKVKPVVGMQLNFDGILGTVVSASAGRVIIDFNHPLAGKTLHYKLKINKILHDTKEKVFSLLELYTKMDANKFEVDVSDKSVKIINKSKSKLEDKLMEIITEDLKKYVGIEKIEFTENEEKEVKKE
jgi:FKBP-type peptidyl-prolyl cis-trans isomerase SlyD